MKKKCFGPRVSVNQLLSAEELWRTALWKFPELLCINKQPKLTYAWSLFSWRNAVLHCNSLKSGLKFNSILNFVDTNYISQISL